MVTVIPRAEWGARYPNGAAGKSGPVIVPLPFSEWWLHHSVTIAPDLTPPFDDEYAAMRTLESIGQARFGQGISYTFPIMPNGRVYEGHGIDRRGAHTAARNDIARAICLVGNYDVQPVTAAQIESAAQLMVAEYRAGRATRYTLTGGHRQLKATSCPGDNGVAAIPAINARAEALMRGAPPIDMEDDMPLTDAEIERVAARSADFVWSRLIPAVTGPGGKAIGPAYLETWLQHIAVQATAAAQAAGHNLDTPPPAVIDAAAIAAAIPPALAAQVADELAKRLTT